MDIVPNRKGLKYLADLNIDVQFLQQYGQQVFNYQGQSTQDFESICALFQTVITDLKNDLQNIESQIPVFKA